MTDQDVKKQLEILKKQLSKLGVEALQSKTPIEIDKATRYLRPFANLENAFDREIRKFTNQNKLNEQDINRD